LVVCVKTVVCSTVTPVVLVSVKTVVCSTMTCSLGEC
jgi:hypothetical protein